MIEIEKGLPLPAETRGNRSKLPWDGMEVGDSFVVPPERFNTISGSASYAAKVRGWRFTTRTTTENGQRVVRVWRVE